MGEETPRRKRTRLWAIGWLVVTLVVLAGEYQNLLKGLQTADVAVARAMGSVSVSSFGFSMNHQARVCDPDAWFVCRPAPMGWCVSRFSDVKYRCDNVLNQLPQRQTGPAAWVQGPLRLAARVSRIPEAVFYAIGQSFRARPADKDQHVSPVTRGVMSVILVLVSGVIAVFLARRSPIGVIVAWPLVVVAMSAAFWVIQHLLMLAAGGVWLVLELLIVAGAVPLSIYTWLKGAHSAKELAESAHKAAANTETH